MNGSQFRHDMRARTVPNLLDFAARTHGDRPFLRESGSPSWLSFADTLRSSRALARGLARHGVKPGDYVPFMLPNCLEFVLAWFAVNLRAAAYVSVNTSLVGDLLAAQFAIGRARLWVMHADFLPLLEALPASLRASVEVLAVVGLAPEQRPQGWTQVVRFETLFEEGGDDPIAPSHFLDVGAIGFTSGTTGPSKGVMVTQAQAVSTALTFADVVEARPGRHDLHAAAAVPRHGDPHGHASRAADRLPHRARHGASAAAASGAR